jgi:crossover junction endodeoxyribonuclease RuvC
VNRTEYTVVIGIDNGLDGGVVALEGSRGGVKLNLTPTLGARANKREYDLAEMVRILEPYAPANLPMGIDAQVFIERAQAMPKQGVSSTFSIGNGYGSWKGILAALRLPFEIVSPQTWQKVMFSGIPVNGDTKRASAIVAQRLYPGIDWRRSTRARKTHDGLTDALCLAEYGKRRLGASKAGVAA